MTESALHLPGYKLPPLMFTQQEALTTLLGLLAAHSLKLTVDTVGMVSALAKRKNNGLTSQYDN